MQKKRSSFCSATCCAHVRTAPSQLPTWNSPVGWMPDRTRGLPRGGAVMRPRYSAGAIARRCRRAAAAQAGPERAGDGRGGRRASGRKADRVDAPGVAGRLLLRELERLDEVTDALRDLLVRHGRAVVAPVAHLTVVGDHEPNLHLARRRRVALQARAKARLD